MTFGGNHEAALALTDHGLWGKREVGDMWLMQNPSPARFLRGVITGLLVWRGDELVG